MRIKPIVMSAAFALVGALAVGSAQAADGISVLDRVSADKLSAQQGFAVLDRVSADKLSAQEMATVRGTAWPNGSTTKNGVRPPPPGHRGCTPCN